MIRALLLLLVVAVAVFLPQLALPEWRGTEGRRVQIALEMVRHGDWLVPTLGGEATLAKPPLHYWILATLARWFGPDFVAMRLPSVLALWGLAALGFVLHRRVFGVGAAWIVALGILLAPVLLADAASAEIDPLFAALTAGSLFALAHGVAGERRGLVLLSGVLGGLAVMTKGPPFVLFAAGAWLVWWRHRRLQGALLHFAPLLLLPLAYYLPLWLLRVEPGDFLAVAREESVGRMDHMRWDHVRETPLYFLRAFLVALPLGLWGLWEFRSSRNARMGPEDLTLRMGSAAAVLAVFLLALFPARPTRYLMPMVPLVVFAVAPAAAHYARQQLPLGRLTRALLRGLGALGAVMLLAIPVLPAPVPTAAIPLAAGLGLLPVLVRTPRQVMTACLLLPLLAAWTVLPVRSGAWVVTGRMRTAAGPLLAAELRELGVDDELRTIGHFHSGLLLGTGLLPAGQELPRQGTEWTAADLPTTRFVLRESEVWPPLAGLPDHRERLRLCLPGEDFILAERAGRGR